MTEDPDYKDILEDNVSEAKKAIRDLEDPDYSQLLQIEKDNKDRKTVKEFLETKMGTEEETEEVVEEIEEETNNGLLGAYSKTSLVTGGLLFGLLIGLVAGMGAADYTTGDVQLAKDTVTDLLEASGFEGDISFTEATQEHGLYYVNLNMTTEGVNGTSTSSRAFYVSKDGELLFPEVQSPLITSPINVEEALQSLQQSQAPTGNQTTTAE